MTKPTSRAIYVQHCLVLDKLELVICDGRYFVIDRELEELQNILDPREVLRLEQRQSGMGGEEVMERYAHEDGSFEAVVLDSSPSWLEQLPKLKILN